MSRPQKQRPPRHTPPAARGATKPTGHSDQRSIVPSASGQERASPAAWLAVAPWALTVVALGVRLYHLGREPLWFDEAYTASTAVMPVTAIISRLQSEGNAPLYYVILHVWSLCFGDGEYALRLVSTLLGALTIPLLYYVGMRMFSRSAGLIAAALAALSPLHVHYSQEVRMYAMVPPLALALLYGLSQLLVAPTRFAFVTFVAAAVAGLYVHYYFLFILPLAAGVLLLPQRRRTIPVVAAALALVMIGFLPWVPTFVGQSGSGVQDWVADWWRTRPLWYAVPWSLESLGPGAQYPPLASFKFYSASWARGFSLGLAMLVLGGAAWGLYRPRRGGDSRERLNLALSLGAVLVPLLIAFVVSLLRSPIYVVGRHDLIAWGAYYLLAGAVLSRLDSRVLMGAVAVWLGLSLVTLWPYFTNLRPRSNYADLGDQIARSLDERARPDEMVVFTAATRTMTEYYLRHDPTRLRLVSYPLENDAHLGWTDPRVRTDAAFASAAAQEFSRWLVQSGSIPEALWIVAPQSRGSRPLLAELERSGYRPDPARTAGVLLCLRRG